MAIANRLKFELKVLRYIIPTMYFNFHYLPFKQAIKLPIVFYKPHFGMLKGKVLIKPIGGGKISHGMIRLGFYGVALYPNDGIKFQIAGGSVEFQGKCYIGNSGSVAVGKYGRVIFGDNFNSSAAIKIAGQHSIKFGNNVLCGWEAMFMDSDFHQMTSVDGSKVPDAFAPIEIGDECWFGTKALIMKGTSLPNNCTVATNSMCNKKYTVPYTIYAGIPAAPKKTGYFRDYKDDTIKYPTINE